MENTQVLSPNADTIKHQFTWHLTSYQSSSPKVRSTCWKLIFPWQGLTRKSSYKETLQLFTCYTLYIILVYKGNQVQESDHGLLSSSFIDWQ